MDAVKQGNTITKPPLVIYHAHCLDGDASAYCFYKKFGDTYDYLPGKYQDGKFEEQLESGIFHNRIIYLVDFSYPEEIMEQLLALGSDNEGTQIIVLDHHKTAIEMLQKFKDRVNLNISHCTTEMSGCGICWYYLYGTQEMPLGLQHIQDRDLWKFKLASTEAFCEYFMNMLDRDYRTFSRFTSEDGYRDAIRDGSLLVRARERRINFAVPRAIEVKDHDGNRYWDINATADISELGNVLCKKPFPDGDLPAYSMIWYSDEMDIKVSLRSIGDFDVSAISKRYGGGGHKNASGHTFKNKIVRFEDA